MKGRKSKQIQWIKWILVASLIGAVGYIGVITVQIRSAQSGSGNLFRRIPDQQIVVIADDEELYSRKIFMEGVQEAGERLNIVVQTEVIANPTDDDEIRDAFSASVYANVDGIVVNLASNDRAEAYIRASEANGIPVVAVGNDSITSKRSAYIGTNQYNLGVNVGEMILSDSEAKNVLLIFDFNYTDKKSAATNNYLNGFLSILHETPGREIQTLFLEEDQRIESVIRELLVENRPDVVIATDPINSLRVTKTLIDLNEIGRVKIFASSNHPDIINYLKKGTIQATAVENYSLMGDRAVQVISDLGKEGATSAYQAMPFEIVTEETVGDFDGLE